MEDQQHIDKLFRESLNQRSFDIPQTFLEDLDKRLDRGEKKRSVFLWWFIALFCLTGLSVLTLSLFQFPVSNLPHFEQLHQTTEFTQSRFRIQGNSKSHENTCSFKVSVHQQTVGRITPSKVETFSNKPKNQTPENIQNFSKNKQFVGAFPGASLKIHSGNISDTLDGLFQDTFAPLSRKEIDFDTPEYEIIPIKQTSKNFFDSKQQTDALKKNNTESAWRTEIQIFGGLGGNLIHDSHSDKAYLEKITENQSSILVPSFGIQGNLSYKKFTFGAGTSYSQTGEKYTSEIIKYTYKDSTYSQHVIDTILVFDDTLGIWIPEIHDTTIYHSFQYKDSILERKSFKNNYSWISIPLHFGYRFELGSYELIPRLGAQFNFGIAKNKGSFPNEDFNGMIDYQAIRFNISYLIQLEARRNFGKWYIFINPYFKSMIKPTVSGDLIQRRYSSWGIQFGIGLKL